MRALFVMFLALLVVGCSSGPASAPQGFDIAGVKIDFSPPAGWKQRPADPKDKDHKLVAFEHPAGKGYIFVGAVPKGKLDKPMLDQLGVDIVANKGRIISDKYISVAGEKDNAYRMEFEVKEGAERGVQVHFVRADRLFSVVMNVPPAEFAKSQQQFDQLVQSIKFPGS